METQLLFQMNLTGTLAVPPQVGHKADEAGEGPRADGAAGHGGSTASVQIPRRGDGGDDGGAPGESQRAAGREGGAETTPPGGQTANPQLAEPTADAVRARAVPG